MSNVVHSPANILRLLYLVVAICLATSAQKFPEQVATHFNFSGQPDGWMSRPAYLLFIAGLSLGLPLFIVGSCYVLRFLPPGAINLPHRKVWLAPERRAA